MNLHKLAPAYFPDEEFDPELEKVYKERSMDSHIVALETIYAMGVQCVLEMRDDELEELQERFNVLQQKHENLLGQIVAQRDDDGHPGDDVQLKVVEQVMGMGGAFAK